MPQPNDPLGLRNLDYMLDPDYYAKYYFGGKNSRVRPGVLLICGLLFLAGLGIVGFVGVNVLGRVFSPPPTVAYCDMPGTNCPRH
jgi:hypothetical protein